MILVTLRVFDIVVALSITKPHSRSYHLAFPLSATAVAEDIGKLILRLVVGGLLLFHGAMKLRHGIGFVAKMVQTHNLPSWFAYGVFAGEVLAPILLIIGILTRPAAALVVVDIAVAIALVKQGAVIQLERQTGAVGGELEFLYMFGALAIVFLGSGRIAISRGRGALD